MIRSLEIIGSAIEVHRVLGPGMLESAYARCLSYELIQKGIEIEREVPVPLRYKNIRLDCGYRMDLLVAGYVIVEVKAVERLLPIRMAQVMGYLRLPERGGTALELQRSDPESWIEKVHSEGSRHARREELRKAQ